MTYEYPSYNLKKKEKSRIKKPMTWKELLVKANFTEGDGRKNLYHFLPEGVSLKDEVTRDFPEAFKLASTYREIQAIQASIETKYPDRCLSCNGRGGELIFEEDYDYPFFCYCSDCVNRGLDPCNTSLKLHTGPWGIISPTRNQEIYTGKYSSSSWHIWDKLFRLRTRAAELAYLFIEMASA